MRWFRRLLPLAIGVLVACGTPPDAPSASGPTTPSSTPAFPAASVVTPGSAISFPQQAPSLGPQAYPAALLEGTLVLEQGCLRVRAGYSSETYTPVWPPDVLLHAEVEPVEVRNPDGRVVARVGEMVQLGGGEFGYGSQAMENLRAPISNDCPGPYWLTSPFNESSATVPPHPGRSPPRARFPRPYMAHVRAPQSVSLGRIRVEPIKPPPQTPATHSPSPDRSTTP